MFKNTGKKIAILGLAATMCGTYGLVANAQYSGPRYTVNEASYLKITCPCEVEYTAPGGSLRVTGDAMIRTEGNNQIVAGENAHIYSLSAHNIDHEGNGGANFDIGDIIVSGFENEGQSARDVTVNNANFLIPAPGITMRLRNGTTFDIGATAQETQENLQRAIALRQRFLGYLQIGAARTDIIRELCRCTGRTAIYIERMSNEEIVRLYEEFLAKGIAKRPEMFCVTEWH